MVICNLKRDFGFIVSVLAIWKCGAAYCPVDPRLPPAKGLAILEDLGARTAVLCCPEGDVLESTRAVLRSADVKVVAVTPRGVVSNSECSPLPRKPVLLSGACNGADIAWDAVASSMRHDTFHFLTEGVNEAGTTFPESRKCSIQVVPIDMYTPFLGFMQKAADMIQFDFDGHSHEASYRNYLQVFSTQCQTKSTFQNI